jgi:hypothetical protein
VIAFLTDQGTSAWDPLVVSRPQHEGKSVLNFLWLALGIGALLVAVSLCTVLLRLHRTLGVLEQTLETADESLREVTPEVRGALGNVNDITAGVNLALRSAETGANRLGSGLNDTAHDATLEASAAAHGASVGWRTFWRSLRGRTR